MPALPKNLQILVHMQTQNSTSTDFLSIGASGIDNVLCHALTGVPVYPGTHRAWGGDAGVM